MNFHPGQVRAWESKARFLLVLAGSRSGKSSFAPWWLWREIKNRGPGDYLIAAPTFKLLEQAPIPYLVDAFQIKLRLGHMIGGRYGHFQIDTQGEKALWGKKQNTPTRIVFGHAMNPDSLEAAQYKAAWLDEIGQRQFKQQSWEAVQRRLAIDLGRCLMTTTPYSLNWLKTEVHDRARNVEWAKSKGLPYDEFDADYEVVSFTSIDNPAFSLDEWERLRLTLPPWKFNLFCKGLFSRPAGAVFDNWDTDVMTDVEGFVPPAAWPRYVGIDFGYPNFAAVFITEEMTEVTQKDRPDLPPQYVGTGRFRIYKEYRPQESRQTSEHIRSLKRDEPRLPEFCVGGHPSEQQWRDQFIAEGYPINEPDQREVEVGIDRIYAMIAENRLIVHRSCPRLIEELESFSRMVDDQGNVLDDLEDEGAFHGIASLRYVISWLRRVGQNVDIFF